MNYIVFDLEWNQCPDGKANQVKGLPFEIVEIGAVKLDPDRRIIGSFNEVVKPTVYRKMNSYTNEIIHMRREELKRARPFKAVFQSFFKWCGTDYRFCTWGNADVTELQRNLKYFKMGKFVKGPVNYYDIQKIYSIEREDGIIRRNLEYAVDTMGIDKFVPFHRAFADAWYTSEVFCQLSLETTHANYSIDYYCNPKTKRDEIYAVFHDHSKFVSREFKSRESLLAEPDITEMTCYACNLPARMKIDWFSVNAKNYYCLAYCEEHGYLRGKLRMKKSESEKVFCLKTARIISKEDAQRLRERQEAIRLKRKQKRVQETSEGGS